MKQDLDKSNCIQLFHKTAEFRCPPSE